ncbi:Branched-chain amino acid ABC transporter, amino acid-binding protein [Paraburkholderia caribensis MBA4]|uniref:Branched-chain amino acid ABC transporter, amino acid-binding protein n=2 Tax=Paraburkholderia caribensis TaxID=75105 RepID=A0A0P0RI70_9BURK|nr:Branched-chain amino acid ABC transporter, amino acid-binding protein [Paraburkholderia caribensis MBA4]
MMTLAVLFSCCHVSLAAAQTCDRHIKLGTTISETGPYSSMTARWADLTREFFTQINKDGGIYLSSCKRKVPVDIEIFDDQGNAATAVQLFEKMASNDNVDFFVGPDWTALGMPVSPIAEKHQIPIVMANIATEAAFERGMKYMFATPFPTIQNWSTSYFQLLGSVNPKPKTIYFVTQDNPSQKAIAETWAARAEAQGIHVVGREIFPSSLKDFSSTILKVRAAHPDVIYVASYDFASVPLIQQMRQQHLNVMNIHVTDLTGTFLRQLGHDAEGITGELPWYPGMKGDYDSFVEGIVQKANIDLSQSTWTMSRIASYLVMVQAIEAAGAIDREKVREVLATHTFKAPTGPIVFDKRGLAYKDGAYTSQVQDGKINVVWPEKLGKVRWPAVESK